MIGNDNVNMIKEKQGAICEGRKLSRRSVGVIVEESNKLSPHVFASSVSTQSCTKQASKHHGRVSGR